MSKHLKTIILIPARYKSSRFPGKPLAPIFGKPMIVWVAELSAKALPKENIFIATEDIKIKKLVESFGYNCILTSDKALTGTDRIAEAIENIDADIIVNVQGDEPLVNPSDIKKVIEFKKNNFDAVINCYSEIKSFEDPKSTNIPKVVFNEKNELLYMSRSLIPGDKVGNKKNNYYKQVCIYGFSKKELIDFKNFNKKSYLENLEDIEILRFLEINKKILMLKLESSSLAVDEPEDIRKVEAFLRKNEN